MYFYISDSLAVAVLICMADAALHEAVEAASDRKPLLLGSLPSHELT